MKLTARFVEIARSGQTSELNDIKGFGFVMNIASHPLKDPSLRIPVVAANVEGSIELKEKFFILMFFVSYEAEQTGITKTVKCFF